jgi:hypothetical protein
MKTTLQPKGKPAITAPVTTAMVSAKRNDEVKVKTYFLFEKGTNEANTLHNSAMELPCDVRNIFASFAANIASRIKARATFHNTVQPAYAKIFDGISCEEMENDYEDLAENAACPLCGKMIDAPYNYVEVVLGKNLNMVFSLRLFVHLLNEHDFSIPSHFASFVFGKFFSGIPIVKLPHEMTRDELLDEVRIARAANESLTEEVAKMSRQLSIIVGSLACKDPSALIQEISIDPATGTIAPAGNDAAAGVEPAAVVVTNPPAVVKDIWEEVKKEVGNTGDSKSDDGDDSVDDTVTEKPTEDVDDADDDADDEDEGEADESSQEEEASDGDADDEDND